MDVQNTASWQSIVVASKRCTNRRSEQLMGGANNMPSYFFDFHDANGVIIDDQGQELPDLEAAGYEARRSIGEAVRELTGKGLDGRAMIEVRDKGGPVLRVVGTILTTDLG